MKKTYVFTAFGLILIGVGLALLKAGWQLVPAYVSIGVGCGVLFGYGISGIITDRIYRRHPEVKKQKDIQQNDERNIAVSSQAKARAYDLMTYVFAALILGLTLMGVETKAVILSVFCYLAVQGYYIYCHYRYAGRM